MLTLKEHNKHTSMSFHREKILRRRVKCFNITYTHFWQDHNKVEMNPFNVFLLGMKEKPYL